MYLDCIVYAPKNIWLYAKDQISGHFRERKRGERGIIEVPYRLTIHLVAIVPRETRRTWSCCARTVSSAPSGVLGKRSHCSLAVGETRMKRHEFPILPRRCSLTFPSPALSSLSSLFTLSFPSSSFSFFSVFFSVYTGLVFVSISVASWRFFSSRFLLKYTCRRRRIISIHRGRRLY